jgi:hypothetical protein
VRTIRIIGTLIIHILILESGCAQASPDICKTLLLERAPAAYLIARSGKMEEGPIDLGKVPLDNNTDGEDYSIDSGYSVVVSPMNAEVRNIPSMGYGAELIKEQKSACPKTSTYAVKLKWARRRGELRPFKFEAPLPYFERPSTSGYFEEIDRLYKFDSRIIGEMIAPIR